MRWRDIWTEALAAVGAYFDRTVVTIVSLGWGLASFVVLMSYGQGLNRVVQRGIESIGDDLMIAWSGGRTSEQPGGMTAGRRIWLTVEDAETIRESAHLVQAISPEVFRANMTLVRDDREMQYPVRGVWPEYSQIRNMRVQSGRWLNDQDARQRRRVAVVGATVARELFRGARAVSEWVSINGLRFAVIGVLETKSELQSLYSSDNRSVFVPYETMSWFVNTRYPVHFVWSPVSADSRQASLDQVRRMLARLHDFSPTDENAVPSIAFDEYLKWIEQWAEGLALLLLTLGGITLSIGGIGLANIMLSSVTDRTRQIGVAKALGARRASILTQFLVEAIVITGAGWLVGMTLVVIAVFGIGSLPQISYLLWSIGPQEAATGQDLVRLEISPSAVLVCSGALLAVGLVAGMIPAIKASNLDPAEALRYE